MKDVDREVWEQVFLFPIFFESIDEQGAKLDSEVNDQEHDVALHFGKRSFRAHRRLSFSRYPPGRAGVLDEPTLACPGAGFSDPDS